MDTFFLQPKLRKANPLLSSLQCFNKKIVPRFGDNDDEAEDANIRDSWITTVMSKNADQ